MIISAKGAFLAPVFLLFPCLLSAECSEIVKFQAKGITGSVIEHDNGILTLKVVIDLNVYAKHTSARKRIEKLTFGMLEQIRDISKMKLIHKRHYFIGDQQEIYESNFIA